MFVHLDACTLATIGLIAAAIGVGVWVIRDGNANDDYKRRMLSGQPVCRNCGYDLRGGVERCPECGTLWHRRPPSKT
jgi:hypothetical protein